MNELSLENLIGTLEDKASEEVIEKTASEIEPSVSEKLKETLTKEASASQLNEDTTMSDKTGNAIADSIFAMLEKQAAHGESGGNLVQTDIDEMEAQQSEAIVATPRQGKTVTEVAKALMARAPAGAGEDEVETETAAKEGNSEAAVSAKPSDIEKSAAVTELMGEGYSFEDAFSMVKSAAESMELEAEDLEKVAAVNELVQSGISFDEAYTLVKEACEVSEEYSDLEKVAAVNELMDVDGLSFEEAFSLVKEASLAGK